MLCRIIIALSILNLVVCKPTLYKKNANDNLEPVLIPVSSTVIPLSVYRASDHALTHATRYHKNSKPSVPIKLLTIKNKKLIDEEIADGANIKQISKDQFNLQPH